MPFLCRYTHFWIQLLIVHLKRPYELKIEYIKCIQSMTFDFLILWINYWNQPRSKHIFNVHHKISNGVKDFTPWISWPIRTNQNQWNDYFIEPTGRVIVLYHVHVIVQTIENCAQVADWSDRWAIDFQSYSACLLSIADLSTLGKQWQFWKLRSKSATNKKRLLVIVFLLSIVIPIHSIYILEMSFPLKFCK